MLVSFLLLYIMKSNALRPPVTRYRFADLQYSSNSAVNKINPLDLRVSLRIAGFLQNSRLRARLNDQLSHPIHNEHVHLLA